MLTNSGITEILDDGTNDFTHLAVGTGAAAEAATDTALGTEHTRVATGSIAAVGATVTIRTLLSTAQGNAASNLSECGLLSASSAGTLWARKLFGTSIAKTAAKELIISWSFTLANA